MNKKKLKKLIKKEVKKQLFLYSVVSSDFCEDGKHEVMADNGYCGICNKKIGCVV